MVKGTEGLQVHFKAARYLNFRRLFFVTHLVKNHPAKNFYPNDRLEQVTTYAFFYLLFYFNHHNITRGNIEDTLCAFLTSVSYE